MIDFRSEKVAETATVFSIILVLLSSIEFTKGRYTFALLLISVACALFFRFTTRYFAWSFRSQQWARWLTGVSLVVVAVACGRLGGEAIAHEMEEAKLRRSTPTIIAPAPTAQNSPPRRVFTS